MPDDLRLGLSPEATLEVFAAACNRDADRVFITESWFAPFKKRLLDALPAQLTERVLDALRDALLQVPQARRGVEFIEQQPTSWDEFARWNGRAARKSDEIERHEQSNPSTSVGGWLSSHGDIEDDPLFT